MAYPRVKAEQATTYSHSWLTSRRKVNTFPTLPESLTLALSTRSPLLSSKRSTTEPSPPSPLLAAALPWFPCTDSFALRDQTLHVWEHARPW